MLVPPEDATGALVPAGHQSVEVGGDDGVIDGAVEDLPVERLGFPTLALADDLLGCLMARAEDAADLAGLVADRGIEEREVRFLVIALPVHDQLDLVHVGRLARIAARHDRAHAVDEFGPDLEEGPSQGGGMVAPEDLRIAVVVEHRLIGTPGHEHRLVGVQDDAGDRP